MFSDFAYFFQIWHQNTFDFHPWVVVLTSGTRTTRLKLPLQFVCCSGNVEGGVLFQDIEFKTVIVPVLINN